MYIFDAVRTPRARGIAPRPGRPGGALNALAPDDLVGQLIAALSRRLGADVLDRVAHLILGTVGQVGAQGGHLAHVCRQTARLSRYLGDRVSPLTLNNYCVSGLTAINQAALRLMSGETDFLLAGGVEMLSHVPFQGDGAWYYTQPETMKRLSWLEPIMGAELLATIEGFSKLDLDELTLASHQKAAAAWDNGHYDTGVVLPENNTGTVLITRDDWVKSDLTLADLQNKPPAFQKLGASGQNEIILAHRNDLNEVQHVHSLFHVPGPSDGAAIALLGARAAGEKAGLTPKARIRGFSDLAGDPVLQFGAGFEAMESALRFANLTLGDIDLIEFMEAFAAPPLKFLRDYGVDPEIVNVNGGHLAMGHPMGATGAILVTTLLHEMERRDVQLGLVVALAGGGIGSAIILDRDIGT